MATPELLELRIEEGQSRAEPEPFNRFFLDFESGTSAFIQQAIHVLQTASAPTLDIQLVMRRAFVEQDEREREQIAANLAARLLLVDGVREVRLLSTDPLRLLAVTRDRDMQRDLTLQRTAIEAMRGQEIEEWELVVRPTERDTEAPGLRLHP